VAETADELTVRVLGLPPGFWAGIIGFAVAALALYAVVRETTSLARLARSVERFGEAIEPVSLPERGAREVRALIAAFNRMQSRIAELIRGRAFMRRHVARSSHLSDAPAAADRDGAGRRPAGTGGARMAASFRSSSC
jgi:HAMP domain